MTNAGWISFWRTIPFLYALDDNSALAVQLIGIAGVGLLLAVLQPGAGVGFEHAVLRAEVAGAEAAITDDTLSGFLALLEVATWLAGRHCDCWLKGGSKGYRVLLPKKREGQREGEMV